MTFNIRFENDRDGTDSWVHRRELVVRIIERYTPDIIGTQEGRWTQLVYLRDKLPEYYLHAPGRTIDPTCQYPTLFIRKKGFNIVGGKEFWLSKTPEIHRSKDWGSAFPRMINYANVLVRESGATLWVAVTHLDHKGAEARIQQAGITASWVKEQKGPVVLVGDFNDKPGASVHQILTGPEAGLVDTWEALGHKEDSMSFTHHGFTGTPQDSRIDWILISPHFKVLNGVIIRDHFAKRYPSDHFPYMVDLQFIPVGRYDISEFLRPTENKTIY